MDDNIDSKYEFNAPKYIDFLQGDVDEDADKWFDERDGDEGGIDIDMAPFYEEALEKNGFENATSAISAALRDNDVPVTESAAPASTSCKTETVIETHSEDVEMMEEDVVNASEVKQTNESAQCSHETHELKEPQLPDQEKDKNVNEKADQYVEVEKTAPVVHQENVTEEPNSLESVPKVKPIVKPRKSNIRTSWNSPSVAGDGPIVKRSMARRSCNTKQIDYSDTKKRKKTLSEDASVFNKKHKPEVKLTTSETPQFVRKLRERGLKRGPSTEALQLKQIKQLQKQTRENVRKNEKKMRQALKAGPYMPIKSSEVTHPVEFNFESDKRIKTHGMHTRSESNKTFQHQLRQHPPSPTFKKEPTKVKPFNFVMAHKDLAVPAQKWESMAQFAMNFQTKTPERFRAKPRTTEGNNSLNGGASKINSKPQLTVAKTPLLLTKKRYRPINVESAQQMEEKTAEEIKKYKFKATEFDPRIVEKQGMYGVKKIPEVSKTEFKPFRFEIEQRIEQRKQKNNNEKPTEKPVENKARNTSLNNGAKADRPRKTEVKPFSFESRDKERYQKKEEKIKEIYQQEEKMHEFHARPLPSFSPDALPAVRTKEATMPNPFHISSGSMAYKQKYQQQLNEQNAEERSRRQFKAKDVVVTKREPFKPLHGLIPPTNVKDVVLNSDVRAKERAKFEQWKHEQERNVEEEKMRFQKEKELAELEAIKQLRKEAVPKANPVRQYKLVEIHKSGKPLTEPQTPNFECKKRAMTRT